MTFPQTISAGQANKETPLQEDLRSLAGASVYGRRDAGTSGLTFAWQGGVWSTFTRSDGAQLLGASTTTYMVVLKSTGVESFSTSTTNWNDTTNYGKAYRLVTSASGITTIEDARFWIGGILAGGSSGGSGTVTASGGSLTSNAVVLGAGTTDTKVVVGVTTDGTSRLQLGVAGSSVGGLELRNATSGTMSFVPPTGALGTTVLTGLGASDTLVGIAATQTLTNKTLTSPTLTTPALGTPASGNLSSCTADGTNAVGFKNIPQNSQSTAYTTVLADAGKHLLHPSADTTARTFTIDSNANVAYPIGTAITFVNQNAAGTLTIAITSDTMRLAGAGTTGSRTLAANGVATAIKIVATEWIISGTGLT
jgi:hypothetical protein